MTQKEDLDGDLDTERGDRHATASLNLLKASSVIGIRFAHAALSF